jgi:hypothetical protein
VADEFNPTLSKDLTTSSRMMSTWDPVAKRFTISCTVTNSCDSVDPFLRNPCINHSETQLFADDTILFRKINNTKDSDLLQQYLSALEKWVNEWQMSLIQPSAQLSECHQVRPSL